VKKWNFITNHGLVLLYISHNPQCTMREMAVALGVTERSIQRVIKDLEQEGYVTWEGTGKGNCYQINDTRGLKHELTRDVIVADLLGLLGKKKRSKTH
jgi:predicted transcriptional regulator